MKVSFTGKGDFEAAKAWLRQIANIDPSETLNQIANDGVKRLSSNTPKDTGETAAGWKTEITKDKGSWEIAWENDAHPEAEVNVAKLIELGHGTGTGGYVPPNPYIKRSMDPLFNNAGNKLAKELIK